LLAMRTVTFDTEIKWTPLIIGKPGTGKSHVAKAVAYQATLQGYDARYLEADTNGTYLIGRMTVPAHLLASLGTWHAQQSVGFRSSFSQAVARCAQAVGPPCT
jgi:MoxR-like ATPase